jgi:hypothetical protein
VFLVRLQIFRAPKFLIAEKIYLAGAPAGESEPLDVVGFADVIERGIIERRMCCPPARWWQGAAEILLRSPIDRTRPRSPPHGDFAVAKWLLREPLHHVVAVVWLLREWLKFAAGIAAAAHIDKRKRVTVGSEICGSRVIRIGDVRCESESDWCARDCSIFCSWEIKRCVQFDLITHRNFYVPAKIVVR